MTRAPPPDNFLIDGQLQPDVSSLTADLPEASGCESVADAGLAQDGLSCSNLLNQLPISTTSSGCSE